MTVCENGTYREMTPQETEDFESRLSAIENETAEADDVGDRLEMIEECLLEMSMIIYA